MATIAKTFDSYEEAVRGLKPASTLIPETEMVLGWEFTPLASGDCRLTIESEARPQIELTPEQRAEYRARRAAREAERATSQELALTA